VIRDTLAYLILTLVCLGVSVSVSANESVSISIMTDTESVYLGDTVVLDIESTGLLDPLDTDLLHARAPFLRETVGTRIAVIGGKVVEIAVRRMVFKPAAEGTVIFGPLIGEGVRGRVRSNSVAVEVLPALDSTWAPGGDELALSVELSNHSPRVGEEVVADFILRHRYQVAEENIALPTLDAFDLLPVFESRRTLESDRQGWRRTAWRYLLYPKRSGKLTLDAVTWNGTMIRSRTQRGPFKLIGDPLSLDVQAAPPDTGDWWLPARDLSISEAWSSDVKALSAGDEIIRTITLTAKGALAQQLPEVHPLPSRAISSTPIGSERQQQLIDGVAVATAEFRFRMRAQSPVPVFLDTVRVRWWNTVSHTAEDAILPARRINIGLPNRADLLSELALRETGWSRLQLWLQGGLRWQAALGVLAVLAVAVAIAMWLPGAIRRLHNRFTARRSQQQLHRYCREARWEDLFRALDESALDLSDPRAEQLKRRLSEHLFGRAARVEDSQLRAYISELLDQLPLARMPHAGSPCLPSL